MERIEKKDDDNILVAGFSFYKITFDKTQNL